MDAYPRRCLDPEALAEAVEAIDRLLVIAPPRRRQHVRDYAYRLAEAHARRLGKSILSISDADLDRAFDTIGVSPRNYYLLYYIDAATLDFDRLRVVMQKLLKLLTTEGLHGIILIENLGEARDDAVRTALISFVKNKAWLTHVLPETVITIVAMEEGESLPADLVGTVVTVHMC